MDNPPQIAPASAAEWRAWLSENHGTSRGVWLVISKKSAAGPKLSYDEAVEEALCYGWIDGKTKTVDDRRFQIFFTSRKPGSVWAQSNKRRVAHLIEQGRMQPAGLEKVEAAQRDGSWSAYDEVEAMVIPEDLAAALKAQPPAWDNYQRFSASLKRMTLAWIVSARRPATRERRIARVVESAAANLNPLPDAAAERNGGAQP